MKRPFRVDLVKAVQVLADHADNAEQVAHHVCRMAEAAERIVNDIKGFYDVISPLAEALRSKQACPLAQA
jgi:hypothetical protein